MIKCLCKENVQDKFTGEDYVAGKEYEFTKERAKEVTNTKYFDEVINKIVDKVMEDEEINKLIDNVVEEVVKEVKPKRTRKSAK
jgi:uncharacterized protein with gpF-like domain